MFICLQSMQIFYEKIHLIMITPLHDVIDHLVMTNHELWKLFVRIINNIPQPSCIVLFSAVLVIIYSSGEFNTFLHHHLDKPDPHWRMSHTNKKVLSIALCNLQNIGCGHRKQKICQNSFSNKIFIW